MSEPTDKLLFISDAHLGGFSDTENEEIEQQLINLIDYCEREGYKIYILGDLFDYWMEYPNHTPELGKELLQRFESYNNATGNTLFITGNHDNWTNGYFKTLGFEVERNHRFLNIAGKQTLLLHGDGLTDSSFRLRRPLFHRLLRNSNFVKLYQALLPPSAGLGVMKKFSQIARSREVSETEKKLNKWAKQELETSETDVILCGHDHTPRMHKYKFGTFINLGTFYEHKSVVIYNNNNFSLVIWNDQAKKLQLFYPDK